MRFGERIANAECYVKFANGYTIASAKARVLARNTGRVCINDVGRCVYEAPDEYGNLNHCGIGCFIPAGHPAMGCRDNVGDLLRTFPDLVAAMPFTDAVALTQLQDAHDGADTDFGGNAHTALLAFFDTIERETPTSRVDPTEAIRAG
jgi:hypothetical protein